MNQSMNQLCEPWSGRNALQRTLTIVALAWMLTLGRGTALAAPTQAEVRGADPVAQALLDSRHKPTPTDKLAKRLAQPGAVALPSLFATLARGRFAVAVGERGNSSRPLTAEEHEALVAAIGEL